MTQICGLGIGVSAGMEIHHSAGMKSAGLEERSADSMSEMSSSVMIIYYWLFKLELFCSAMLLTSQIPGG